MKREEREKESRELFMNSMGNFTENNLILYFIDLAQFALYKNLEYEDSNWFHKFFSLSLGLIFLTGIKISS